MYACKDGVRKRETWRERGSGRQGDQDTERETGTGKQGDRERETEESKRGRHYYNKLVVLNLFILVITINRHIA